jgi:LCP family protein required for cell wall assembly
MAESPTATEEPDARPPLPDRRRRRRWPRALLIIGAVVLGLAGLTAGAAEVLVHRFDRQVTHDTLLAPRARSLAPAQHTPVTGPLNYLLIGSDLRSDDPDGGQRSDTIIVAHIDKGLDKAYLLSIPRDLWVSMPPDPKLNFGGDNNKVNAAFEYGGGGSGGTQLLSETLTALLGIQFDGAAVVDFAGLEHAVDVVGGVQMCVREQVTSIHTHRVFQPGCQLMSGAVALDYLRQRYQFADGDFARQAHQQEFLKAFFARAASAGVLSNPIKLGALLQSVAGAMTVDTGSATVPDLVFALRGLRPGAVTGVKLPYWLGSVNELSVVRASDEAGGLFAALRADTLDAWVADHGQWVNQI